MCGIAGILNLDGHPFDDLNPLTTINRVQAHRGPDDEGYYSDGPIGLAHRRLSIIDLGGGHQPFINQDQTVAVVFNGEIYNYQELRRELEASHHVFVTNSDTEVLLHGWREWGPQLVEHLRGMFAFALWDTQQQRLFLARDRLGKKPLYYTVTPQNQLIFGSELKVLTRHPEVTRQIRPESVEEYFMFGYVPDPCTIFEDVYKLPPAHTLDISPNKRCRVESYWDLAPGSEHETDPEQLQYQLHGILYEATALRMQADVPLGAFLSGGVDSSAIVALMAKTSDKPVQTCAIGFSEKDFDESQYAERIAERYQTNHQTHILDGQDTSALDVLPKVYDEPFADSSALPTYRVCQLARKHVTVALSGDGGDEIFAGYRRYYMHQKEERLRSIIPQRLRQTLFAPLAFVYPKADWAPRILRAKSTLQALAMDSIDAYAHSVSKMSDEQRDALFSPHMKRQLGGYSGKNLLRYHAMRAPSNDPVKIIQYLDMKTWLPGDILTKVDRASMANSLEVRSPLLDHQLVEWAFKLGTQDNIKGTQGKYLFKKSLANLVDNDILFRPKQGFSIPLAHWFRTTLADTVRKEVLSPTMLDCGFFNRSYLRQLVTEHQTGARNHAAALWSLLMFSRFLNT
uniref:XrtA/PEP-CTERM system amidotransferase n=1 Tax=Thaumasiovibrio occultus TaxID=1891184 RepID=UPI000B35CB68|nr:XrtA/PEP-CTERM system amidotransferase [Thaumasiovibrio occultus]